MELPPALNEPEEKNANCASGECKDSSLAIASLVTGILGWTLIPLLGSIAAIVTGHLAKRRSKKATGRSTETHGLPPG